MKTKQEILEIWNHKGKIPVCGEMILAKDYNSGEEFWQDYQSGCQAQKDFKEYELEQKSKGSW